MAVVVEFIVDVVAVVVEFIVFMVLAATLGVVVGVLEDDGVVVVVIDVVEVPESAMA